MKKVSWFFCLSMLACTMLFPSCQEDEKSPAKPGDVRFAIRPQTGKEGTAGRKASALPAGAILYVTVVNAAGEVVYDLKEVTLINVGNSVISQPLTLSPGNYTLTEFIVADSQVSYATPKQGSPLAQWVDDPLPVPFTVYDEDVTELSVEVLPFGEGYTPEDFGYVSFNITVAPFPYFRLSVFRPEGETLTFSPVHAYLVDGADTVYSKSLPAATNDIAFVGDLDKAYELVLVQPGYGKRVMSFVLKELIESQSGDPLNVTLEPALTFVTRWGRDFAFRLHGPAGDLTIDWGDGSVMPVSSIRDETNRMEHAYGREAQFFVSVYGSDIRDIGNLEFYYGDGSLTAITLDHLPALGSFSIGFAISPTVLDFSHNPHISSIEASMTNVREFVLPEAPPLHNVSLVGNAGFSSSSLDEAIHAAYLNAITNNMHEGWLYLSVEPSGSTFVAYPSVQSYYELEILHDTYGWEIWPDVF